MAQSDRVDVINHTEELKEAVKTLNVEWLEKYFKVEPMDVIQLSDPQTEIIDKGGMIYYARHNDKIVGTVSLLKVETGIYELGKMAVTQTAQRIGIGTILMEHCINIAKQKKLSKLILYSNTQLKSAIHLYKKYGFVEIALESGHYDRANIKMEKII
ncbi:MAG: GNAT family N-acetyltransferase [Bacteroidetes bacterium]|nr:GNAT family N-acetyltransferase [Bacteroidota bacterium]